MNQAFLMGYVKDIGKLEKLPENFLTEKILRFKLETKSILEKWVNKDKDIIVDCIATSSCSGQLASLFDMPTFSGKILLVGHLDVLELISPNTCFIVDNFEII